jgi:hypothetical protein
VTTFLIYHHGRLHLAISHFSYHQQPKGLKSSDRIGPQQLLEPKSCPREKVNWRSFWPESIFWQSFRSASSELLSGLLCFTPAATTRSTDLFGCSNAPVANKSKYTGRCCFLLHRWGATTVPFRGTYLPSFVTTAANVATPRNTVLQHAGVGWPN